MALHTVKNRDEVHDMCSVVLAQVAVTISEQAAAQPGPGPEVQWLEGLSVL